MNRDVGPETVPLHNAVLCVDCELVTESRSDVCPVCGGHSLLSLAGILGGTLVDHKANRFPERKLTFFNLHISIELTRLEASELTRLIESISTVLAPKLGNRRATLHMRVEPVESSAPAKLKAA